MTAIVIMVVSCDLMSHDHHGNDVAHLHETVTRVAMSGVRNRSTNDLTSLRFVQLYSELASANVREI